MKVCVYVKPTKKCGKITRQRNIDNLRENQVVFFKKCYVTFMLFRAYKPKRARMGKLNEDLNGNSVLKHSDPLSSSFSQSE